MEESHAAKKVPKRRLEFCFAPLDPGSDSISVMSNSF
jgi:hypothetical protein